jgi:hypothetical protein
MEKVNYDVKSNYRCAVCAVQLKENLVKRKKYKHSLLCFKCYRKHIDPSIRTAREIRRDPSQRSIKRSHVPLHALEVA